jgi:hypothetical protein
MEQPLVNKKCLLERFQAKGGWAYAAMPQVPKARHTPFGWVRVRGSIDNFEIKNCHLMPMGNGKLFLPVKADIRKKICKKEGYHEQVVLYEDNSSTTIPEELLLCFSNEPKAYKIFLSYTNGEQKAFIDWIYAAKKEETKIERITQMISKLEKQQKLSDK